MIKSRWHGKGSGARPSVGAVVSGKGSGSRKHGKRERVAVYPGFGQAKEPEAEIAGFEQARGLDVYLKHSHCVVYYGVV